MHQRENMSEIYTCMLYTPYEGLSGKFLDTFLEAELKQFKSSIFISSSEINV